MSKVGFLF